MIHAPRLTLGIQVAKPLVMWVAVELIIMPIMLITVIIVLGVIQSFGFGTIAISAVVLTTIYVLVRWLLRLLLRLEHDEGVESWTEPPP